MTNEIKQFKYEQLDESTADFLRQKESNMREIVGKAYTELGRELYDAQQELAGSRYDGVFEQWYTYLGWKKRTVYNLIDRFTEVQKLHDGDVRERFEEIPVTLSYEISGKSSESTPAKSQAKSEVLAGDIATLKEYRERIKELERKTEQAEQQAEAERKQRERLEEENDELAERLADSANKTSYAKREPIEPYDRMLDEPYSVDRGNAFYELMNEVDDLYKKYAHLKDGVKELRGIAEYDDDLLLKYRKASDFWEMLGEIFNQNNGSIIDAEIIEIN